MLSFIIPQGGSGNGGPEGGRRSPQAGGAGNAAGAGRLLDERYHRDLRSDSREFEDIPPGVARVSDQQECESNSEPDNLDFGFDLHDGSGLVSVWGASTKR